MGVSRLVLSTVRALAVVLDSTVRILNGVSQSLLPNVVDGSDSAATAAAEGGVISRAINDLLFREGDVSVVEQVETLNKSS